MRIEVETRGRDRWGDPTQVRIPGLQKRWLFPRGTACVMDPEGWHTLPTPGNVEYQIEGPGPLYEARDYRFVFSPHSEGGGSFYGSP